MTNKHENRKTFLINITPPVQNSVIGYCVYRLRKKAMRKWIGDGHMVLDLSQHEETGRRWSLSCDTRQ